MKAVICTGYGPPENLQITQVEKPVPKDNEILIKVCATTVNRTDCAYLRARPWMARLVTGFFKPKHSVLGTDYAGVVEAVGKNVSSFKAGDRVFGFSDLWSGCHAQYMTVAEDLPVTKMPENITFAGAAASTEGTHYAINFINKVEIREGQNILVNGATGAIGSAAVQLLKARGVVVTATCRKDHEELVKSLGADRVIDYLAEDFTAEDKKYSHVFDTVGKSTFGKCKRLLNPGGAYISSELGAWGANVFLSLLTPVLSKRKVKFPIPSNCKGSLAAVKKLMEEGKFRSVIDREYPLDQIVEAYRYVEEGQKVGNVVIQVDHDD